MIVRLVSSAGFVGVTTLCFITCRALGKIEVIVL
jgi:hypothetical protein